MKNNYLRLASLAASGLVLASSTLPALSCYAESTNNRAKEEVVYLNLDADGAIKNIDVVNIFNLAEAGQIEDFGNYSSVRNMTTTDKLNYADGATKADLPAGKLYYDGRLAENTSPWNISIKYYLDGVEYSAKDIAGKSGKLKIRLVITKNPSYNGPDFYKNYALNGSIAFDTRKCKNIVADGATIANVGQNKQLTYIALPDRGLNETITMDVEDFEADGLSINGIPLNLDVEVDDSELLAKVAELQDGIVKVDDGANALNSGLETFGSAITEVETQLKKSGLSQEQINAQISQLYGLKSQLSRVNDLISGSQQLIKSSAEIQNGIAQLNDGLTDLENNLKTSDMSSITQLQNQNDSAITNLNTQIANLESQLKVAEEAGADETTITTLETQLESLKSTLMLISANKQANSKLTGSLSTISGIISKLKSGSQTLNSSYAKFDKGLRDYTTAIIEFAKLAQNMQKYIDYLPKTDTEAKNAVAKLIAGYNQLSSGAIALVNGGSQLASGTSELRSATSSLDTQVTDEIDSLLSSIQGEAKIGSFVSDKNTNVEAVQFVIKTDKIEKVESEEKVEETEDNDNFFTRFIKLFKH